MEKRKFGKILISLALTASMLPISTANAKADNLALNKPVTASNDEGQGNTPDKAVDGDLSTRWATDQNYVKNQYIDIDLETQNNIKQVIINFERNDDDQNILGYAIELDDGNGFQEVYRKEGRAKQKEIITFDNVLTASKVRIKVLDADGGKDSWPNVSICEIEIYEEIHELAPEETIDKNHIREAAITTSSNEAASLNGDKVKDGDYTSRTGRWASNYENPTTNIWLKAEFNKITLIKQLNIFFFTRDVAPMPSNVESFSIKYTDENNEEQYLLKNYKNANDGAGFKTDISIVLDEPVIAKDITLCDFVANATQYNNVSIAEFEAFSNEQTKKVTLDSVVSELEKTGGITLDKDITTLELPTVPDGYSVAFNCADFEEIINANGEIFHPLVDKTVQVSYIVTNTATGESKETQDIPYIVAGQYEQLEENNQKPAVIPEIAEWYADSNNTLAVNKITSITYNDNSLEAIVDEFIADYQDYTGIKLSKEKSQIKENAFNFVRQTPDSFLGDEGYTMDIESDKIIVKSGTTTGNMYAMQTILQMYKQNNAAFNIGTMRDYPRFKTRGFLLDVARKPISLDMIKEVSRTMRYYKMNDLQVHLSDNYIFLEQYGKGENENEAFKAYEAFRLESGLANEAGETPTAKDYAISKADFQDFIKSERSLGMNIVPEIDVPAHATSFTKIWPELMVKNQVSSLNRNRPLIDHFDISKQETVDKIKEIFDDYTKGSNPTFDSETTVHIGADEFLANYTAYREFLNEIIPYIKDTNTVRMWGGLTWINDNKTEIVDAAIKDVEMNLWSRDWADGKQMYDMGYKLINTIDSYGYMVPNGNMGRGAYQDLLNTNSVFNNFAPNLLSTKDGWQYIPSGDEQMLGAAFAIWSDNIDKTASGLSESDLYWRFFDAMPVYAEKTWAATGKEKGTINALNELAKEKGTGPRTNPYYQENSVDETYEKYEFNNNNLNDSSKNNRNLEITQDSKAIIENEALKLLDDNSYVTSPIDILGNGNELSFDITLTKPAVPGDILFESDATYGSHDIRIMEDGKLGFTRELYNYYFDYELPVDKKVNIKIVAKQQKTTLYVDGELIGSAKGKFIHNDIVKKTDITNATFALPLKRIGSKTNAIAAIIDNIQVSKEGPITDQYNKAGWTGDANTETVYNNVEGIIEYAFDNDPNTRWHSNWQGATDKLTGENEFYAELNFGQVYNINQFSFTPRTDTNSGQVTKADLYVKEHEGDEWTLIAKNQIFAADKNKKTFNFDAQNVQFVKFVAKESNDGWVAVSEFDIDNKEPATVRIYVDSQTGGNVTGTNDVISGTSVTINATADEGYHFTGWYRNTGEKVSDEAQYTFTVSSNTTLIAHFEKNATHTVVINGKEIVVEDGNTITQPDDPIREGYNFIGWYVGDDMYDFNSPVVSNLIIEARFEQIYCNVNIDGKNIQIAYGERIEKPDDPIKDGFIFTGWYLGDKLYDFTVPVTSDLELVAKFVPEHSPTTTDKTKLQEIIAAAITNYDGYTKESVEAYKKALDHARMILANEQASQEEIDAAIKALKNAVLVKSDVPTVENTDKKTETKHDKNPSAKTGDNIIIAPLYLLLIVSGGMLGYYSKKKFRMK